MNEVYIIYPGVIFWDLAIKKENIMSTGGEGFHTNSLFSLHRISGSELVDTSQIPVLYLFIGFVRACKKYI